MKKQLCPLCDSIYDPEGPEAAQHEHVEPQSGPYRTIWLASGLPYGEWVKTTVGQAWVNRDQDNQVGPQNERG